MLNNINNKDKNWNDIEDSLQQLPYYKFFSEQDLKNLKNLTQLDDCGTLKISNIILDKIKEIINATKDKEPTYNDILKAIGKQPTSYMSLLFKIFYKAKFLYKFLGESSKNREDAIKKLKKICQYQLSIYGKKRRELMNNNQNDINKHNNIKQIYFCQIIRQLFALNDEYNGMGFSDFDGLNGFDEEQKKYYVTILAPPKYNLKTLTIEQDELKKYENCNMGLHNTGVVSQCYFHAAIQFLLHTKPYLAILNKIADEIFKCNDTDLMECKTQKDIEKFLQIPGPQDNFGIYVDYLPLLKFAKIYYILGSKKDKKITTIDQMELLEMAEKTLENNVKNKKSGDSFNVIESLLRNFYLLAQDVKQDFIKNNIEGQGQDKKYANKFNLFLTNGPIHKMFKYIDITHGINNKNKNNNTTLTSHISDIMQLPIEVFYKKQKNITEDNIYQQECNQTLNNDGFYSRSFKLNNHAKNNIIAFQYGKKAAYFYDQNINIPLIKKTVDGQYKILTNMICHRRDKIGNAHFYNVNYSYDEDGNLSYTRLDDATVEQQNIQDTIDLNHGSTQMSTRPTMINYTNISEEKAKKIIEKYKEHFKNNPLITLYKTNIELYYDHNISNQYQVPHDNSWLELTDADYNSANFFMQKAMKNFTEQQDLDNDKDINNINKPQLFDKNKQHDDVEKNNTNEKLKKKENDQPPPESNNNLEKNQNININEEPYNWKYNNIQFTASSQGNIYSLSISCESCPTGIILKIDKNSTNITVDIEDKILEDNMFIEQLNSMINQCNYNDLLPIRHGFEENFLKNIFNKVKDTIQQEVINKAQNKKPIIDLNPNISIDHIKKEEEQMENISQEQQNEENNDQKQFEEANKKSNEMVQNYQSINKNYNNNDTDHIKLSANNENNLSINQNNYDDKTIKQKQITKPNIITKSNDNINNSNEEYYNNRKYKQKKVNIQNQQNTQANINNKFKQQYSEQPLITWKNEEIAIAVILFILCIIAGFFYTIYKQNKIDKQNRRIRIENYQNSQKLLSLKQNNNQLNIN